MTATLEKKERKTTPPENINLRMKLTTLINTTTGEVVDYDTYVINKPSINGVTLEGDKTLRDFGILTPSVQGKELIFS